MAVAHKMAALGLDASVIDLGQTKPAPAPASSAPSAAPRPANPFRARASHESINYDVCAAYPIVGVRYKCSQCPTFDLCERRIVRYERGQVAHGGPTPGTCPESAQTAHVFLRIVDPRMALAGPRSLSGEVSAPRADLTSRTSPAFWNSVWSF